MESLPDPLMNDTHTHWLYNSSLIPSMAIGGVGLNVGLSRRLLRVGALLGRSQVCVKNRVRECINPLKWIILLPWYCLIGAVAAFLRWLWSIMSGGSNGSDSGARNQAWHGRGPLARLLCGLLRILSVISTAILEVTQTLTILRLRLVSRGLKGSQLLRRSPVSISVLSAVAAIANVSVLLKVSVKGLRLGRLHAKRPKASIGMLLAWLLILAG